MIKELLGTRVRRTLSTFPEFITRLYQGDLFMRVRSNVEARTSALKSAVKRRETSPRDVQPSPFRI